MYSNTSVKVFHNGMAQMPKLIGNSIGKLCDIFSTCLVNGTTPVDVTSATVTAGRCRVFVDAGKSFSQYAVVEISGFDNTLANGQKRVLANSSTWIEFETTLPDGPLSGTGMKIKAAAAGWEHPFSRNGNTIVVRSKSTNPKATKHFLRISEVSYNTVNATAYYNMTDIDTGSVPYPTKVESPNGFYWPRSYYNDAGEVPWIIIASDTFFYYTSYSWRNINQIPEFMCFGDIIPFIESDKLFSVIRGGFSNEYVNYYQNEYHSKIGGSSIYTSGYNKIAGNLSNFGTPLNFGFYSNVPAPTNGYAISGNNVFPRRDSKTGGLNLFESYVYDSEGITRGKLPGFYFVANSLANQFAPLTIIEGTDDLEGRVLLGIYMSSGTDYLDRNYWNTTCAFSFFDITGDWN